MTGPEARGVQELLVDGRTHRLHSPQHWSASSGVDITRLPRTGLLLLEGLLRTAPADSLDRQLRDTAAALRAGHSGPAISFRPDRLVMQDFTGVPALVDVIGLREAVADAGHDPTIVQPSVRTDIVVDHSINVDAWGTGTAMQVNRRKETQRNRERYDLLRWCEETFEDLRVFPPGSGIIHQINIEQLATVVTVTAEQLLVPDTVCGTDSHTTMVGGLGVLGWGVGGLEAEAAMLGAPVSMAVPPITGVELRGRLRPGVTATDLVLVLTEMLRDAGVVGHFVEFVGEGIDGLSVPDRSTIANMAPEFGATTAWFPVDDTTLDYLRSTDRPLDHVDLVEAWARAVGVFRDPGAADPSVFARTLTLDLARVESSLAGPTRPQDRLGLAEVPSSLAQVRGPARARAAESTLGDGDVVIAAITSCTTTSNPALMMGAGLLARNAVRRGLAVPSHVKCSLSPGSLVVADYLERSGLGRDLDTLGFHTVGYGCMTCSGNSGDLAPEVVEAVEADDLVVASVLSGNRNFAGRIHPLVRANYLASPALVVAYAVAGSVLRDLRSEPLGRDADGRPVMLADVWPDPDEIAELVRSTVDRDAHRRGRARMLEAHDEWGSTRSAAADRFPWDPESTYVRRPTFLTESPGPALSVGTPLRGARALLALGDSITTDHISPGGAIATGSPAGELLSSRDVPREQFNVYGARRGNHEVMARGAYANPRLRNALVDREGGWTRHLPSGDIGTVYDVARRYGREEVPLVVLAGDGYGSGSSRDWAAKAPRLLGVRAVLAGSVERIHRVNLLHCGVLPLGLVDDWRRLGLTGAEQIDLEPAEPLGPGSKVRVVATIEGSRVEADSRCLIETPEELEIYRQGGLHPWLLRRLLARGEAA